MGWIVLRRKGTEKTERPEGAPDIWLPVAVQSFLCLANSVRREKRQERRKYGVALGSFR
jgi:hypothetical protein